MEHDETHVPVPGSKLTPGKHELQPVAVSSEQVAHDAWHAVQVLLASGYLLLGQLAMQLPSSKYGVTLDGHVRHAVLEAPLQVSQELWHVEHVPCVPTSSTNPPSLGQLVTHVPLDRNGVAVFVQLRQLVLVGPLHVPQSG